MEMKKEVSVLVQMEIVSPLTDWMLGFKYLAAIRPYILHPDSGGVILFLLPWPDKLIPRIGDSVFLEGAPIRGREAVVKNVRYVRTANDGIVVTVGLQGDCESDNHFSFAEVMLMVAANAGFCFTGGELISSVLKRAGLNEGIS